MCKKHASSSADTLDQALHLLLQAHHHDHFYIAFLRSCQKQRRLLHVTRLLAHLSLQCGANRFSGKLADCFVIALVKCGAIREAFRLLLQLRFRSVYSWTALISGLTQSGHAMEALRMLEYMRMDGLEPNRFTLVSLLKACGIAGCLEDGRAIHALARSKRLDSDLYVSSSLISMYSKCGSLREAEVAFDGLSDRNVVAWNAMLSAYLQHNQVEKVLELYRKLASKGIRPNEVTFMFAIQSCGLLASKEEAVCSQATKPVSISIGRALHADFKKNGFSPEAGNSLVNLYGKCRSVGEAQNVFVSLCPCGVASWNAMMSAYVESEQGNLSLQLYSHMLKEGVSPDAWTFVIIIQACSLLADKEQASSLAENRSMKPICLEIISAIHADMELKGFASHSFIGNTLLTTYGKCGNLTKAADIFCRLQNPNVIAWNAMLSVYIDQGHEDVALHLYRQMAEENVPSNEQTFTIVIQACVNILDKQENTAGTKLKTEETAPCTIGKALHADALKEGFASNAYVANNLASMYGKCGMVIEAEHAFQGLSRPNSMSWNAMLSAYVENGRGKVALQLFRLMQEKGMAPNRLAFKLALRACTILDGEEGLNVIKEIVQALHMDIIKEGFDEDPLVGSALMGVYSKLGLTNEVEKVFGELSFDDIRAWNGMLSAYVENGLAEEAFHFYKTFQHYHSVPDDATFFCTLQACSNLGLICFCRELHFTVICTGHIENPLVMTTLIHAYGNCGSMIDAELLNDELPKSDVVAWSALIAGCAKQGNLAASLRMLELMECMLCMPNGVTFLSFLNACNHAGHLHVGLQHFIRMTMRYGITPDFKCYASMIDMMGRAGNFVRVESILTKMPTRHRHGDLWLSMLGACHIHNNLELGAYAFQRSVEVQPCDVAAYVSMANMYSSTLNPQLVTSL